MLRTLIHIALAGLASSTLAGPLGLEMGQPLESLSKQMVLRKDQDFLYQTKTTPRPHPDFESYNLIVTPDHGLCKIAAASKTFTTNVYGDGIREKFIELESALSEKYGKSVRNDLIRPGSIFTDAREWMTALKSEERILVSFWPSNESEKLPGNVAAIKLEAKALSASSGWISLQYEFSNAIDCLTSIRKKKGSNL